MDPSDGAIPDDVLVREIYIEAQPAEIFPYLTRAEYYTRWMGLAAAIDAREGGSYRIDVNGVDTIAGEFLVVEPPHRLVYTWTCTAPDSGATDDFSTVAIELIPEGTGTLLRLTHRGPDRDGRDRHAGGWSHYLGRLLRVLRGEDPGRDPKADPRYRHTARSST